MQKLEAYLVLAQCMKLRRTDLAGLVKEFGEEL